MLNNYDTASDVLEAVQMTIVREPALRGACSSVICGCVGTN